jgi:hypothetical protein
LFSSGNVLRFDLFSNVTRITRRFGSTYWCWLGESQSLDGLLSEESLDLSDTLLGLCDDLFVSCIWFASPRPGVVGHNPLRTDTGSHYVETRTPPFSYVGKA